MTNWKREIPIKQFLDDKEPFEGVRDRVVAVLKRQPEYDIGSPSFDEDFADVVDEMTETDTVRYFDLVLNGLYDWADDNRIWIGSGTSRLPRV